MLFTKDRRSLLFSLSRSICIAPTTLLRSVIPIRVLRDISKMREVGHRTKAFRIGFQLIESVTYLVNDLIKRGKSQIRQVFFAHFFPDMFHRIELWTVGRLSNESHICRNLESF